LAGLVIMIWLTELLDEVQYADFMVFWALLYWMYGAMGGLQYESVRTVTAAAESGARGPRVIPFMVLLATGFAVLLASTAPLWSGLVFSQHPLFSGLVIAVGVLLFGAEVSVVGTLSGRGFWQTGARVTMADTACRFLPFVVFALASHDPRLYKLSAAAGGLAVVAAFLSRRTCSSLTTRGDLEARSLVPATLQSMAANGAAGAFLVGFPTLMSLVLDDATMATSAGLLFAMSMTRAPLIMPILAFQSMIVSHLVKAGDKAVRAAFKLIGLVTAGGLVLAGVAALVGPPLLRLLRPAYHLTWQVVGGLTLGSTAIALIALAGTLDLALKRHTGYMLGWAAAIAGSVGVLCLPLNLDVKVILSLIVGPLVGAAVHMIAALAYRPTA
jgi:hypothetical protein